MANRKKEPSRGILKTPHPADQRYRYVRYYPSDDLHLYIEHFWIVEWDLRGEPPERAETLPHPSVHMIFQRGHSRIRGPYTAKFSTELAGKDGVFSVKFKPAGFYPFAKRPLTRLANRTVSLQEIFGPSSVDLAEAVLHGVTDQARIEIVEKFLRDRKPKADEHVSDISAMVYSVLKDRTIVKVQDLVHRYHRNLRALQRLFARYVGVGPKWVIQRYRLLEAAQQLALQPDVSLADLAMELGYSDQAHFVRDFKSIIGMSPGAYAKSRK